jgi:hypothetical protein
MFAVPPTIPGSENLRTLSVKEMDIETVNSKTINMSKININLSNLSNNFTAYSGIGSIIKGNDTAGQINFDVLTTGINQFRLFFNTPYSVPPIVIITQVNTYVANNNNAETLLLSVNVDTTNDYFTITLPFGTPDVILITGNITINYMVIGVI